MLLGGDFGAFEDCGEFFGVGGEVFKVELLILDAHLVLVCVCVFCARRGAEDERAAVTPTYNALD